MSKLKQDTLYIRFFADNCDIKTTAKEGWTRFNNIKLVSPTSQEVVNTIKQNFNIKRIAEIEPIILESWVQTSEELYLAEIIKEVYSLFRINIKAQKAKKEEEDKVLLDKTINYIQNTYKVSIDKGESYLQENTAYLVLNDFPNEIIVDITTNNVKEVLYCLPYEGQKGSFNKEYLLKDYKEKLAAIEKIEELLKSNTHEL